MSLLVTTKNEFSFNNLIEYRNGTFFDYRKHFCQHVVIVLNYFCHEFETVSCTYPYFKIASFSPYRINHLNELIQIPPSHLPIYRIYGNTIPRSIKFFFKKSKTHFTHSKSNQIIYECWMTIEWCWKTLTRKDFLVSEYFVILYFRFLLSIWKFKNVIDCMFKF